MKTTPPYITSLEPNQVFVFGSNLAGRHGRGAALMAYRMFGALHGQGEGLMGRSYGIATKDRWLNVLPVAAIKIGVDQFIEFAGEHPELEFLVTEIGCGLAGYKPEDIAPLFAPIVRDSRLKNIALPTSFWRVISPPIP